MKKLFVLIALAIAIPACAAAAPAKRIYVIQRPLFNIPAIVKDGASFPLEVETFGILSVTSAELEPIGNPNKRIRLELKQTEEKGTRKTFAATVPAGTPEALYDLVVQCDDTKSQNDVVDYQPHAVMAVKEYKTEFDFAQVTDIHFNAQDYPGRDLNRLRRRVLLEVNAANPEFVIFTGDIGLEPPTYDRDYIYGYEQFSQILRRPVFMVPGNHEMYYDKINGEVIDGAEHWKATYGPMWHSFDYGNMHFIGLANYEGWEPKWRTRKSTDAMFHGTVLNALMSNEEWDWAQKDLAASAAAGKSCVAYAHIPIETFQGGRKVGTPSFKAPGPNTDQFVSLLTKSNCSHIFVGHNHINKVVAFGPLTEILTAGAGAGNGDDRKMAWRSIHVKDGKVTGMTLHEIGWDDLK